MMKLQELNLDLYLNGKVVTNIDNKTYLTKGNLVGFEIKVIDINELYLFTELTDNNEYVCKSFYVVFKQDGENVTFKFRNLVYRVLKVTLDSIILTDESVEYFLTRIGV